jgi:membrane protease YdiL (CAAX protease family)
MPASAVKWKEKTDYSEADVNETTGLQHEDPGNTKYTEAKRRPGIVQVSILFSVTILLFLFIGYRAQNEDFYRGILITEFGLILLPAFLFLLLFKYDLKSVLRLNGTRPLNYLLTFVLMLFAIPVAGVFNLLNLFVVNSVFGKVILNPVPTAGNAQELLVNILVIAGSAGLCEEFLFRGVIQRGLERFGAVKAILLAAFLFSLTHMDFQKIFGTFVLGALIGFIVYRTDSLFCGMFAHFTNNGAVVVIGYLSAKFMALFENSGMNLPEQTDLNSLFAAFDSLSSQQLAIVLYFYGFIFLFLASAFIALLYALVKVNPAKERHIPLNAQRGGKKGLLWLLPGVLLIAGVYFLEVFKFTGAENGINEFARRLLGI